MVNINDADSIAISEKTVTVYGRAGEGVEIYETYSVFIPTPKTATESIGISESVGARGIQSNESIGIVDGDTDTTIDIGGEITSITEHYFVTFKFGRWEVVPKPITDWIEIPPPD